MIITKDRKVKCIYPLCLIVVVVISYTRKSQLSSDTDFVNADEIADQRLPRSSST